MKKTKLALLTGESEELSDAQVIEYLERIGLNDLAEIFKFKSALDKQELTVELLDRLIYAHQTHVPFSTVDIVSTGREPALELDALYKKIVEDKHGGYCFELNMLFEKLLVALGFSARAALSKSVRGRDVAAGINHRAELVQIDGKLYFADVGFGGPVPSCALLVKDSAPAEEVAPRQGFSCARLDKTWWSVEREKSNAGGDANQGVEAKTQTELLFCTAHACDADFNLLSCALSQPGQLFRDHTIVNLRTRGGHISFKDLEMKIRTDTDVYTEVFANNTARNKALLKHVGFAPY